MSRFLRAGLLRDRIDDIVDASSLLVQEINLGDEKLRHLAADIRDLAQDLRDFIDRWDCEPLIYTGRGTTDEVISLLDGLLSKAEGMMKDIQSKDGQ
ncbi:MAG: hypothetical protein ACM3WU_08690 [Bacillota bacterium]